jgi:hypothetical protein
MIVVDSNLGGARRMTAHRMDISSLGTGPVNQ